MRKYLVIVLLFLIAVAVFWLWESEKQKAVPEPDAGEHRPDSQGIGFDGGDSPIVVAGSHLSLELRMQPQDEMMGALELDGTGLADQETVRLIATNVGSEVTYDPWLSLAARELAYQGGLLGDAPPESVLGFLLRSAGAPEMSVAQWIVKAQSGALDVVQKAIENALKAAPSGEGALLVGVGEAALDGKIYDRRVVVVLARRNFKLKPTPRSINPDSYWNVAGEAPPGFHDGHASVLTTEDNLMVLPLQREGHRFWVSIPTGSTLGTLRVSIDGTGPGGPFKLLQLETEVGRTPPREFSALIADTEEFVSVEDAEGYALALLNRDRKRLGIAMLLPDSSLQKIARSHSEEMSDKSYFAHLSPSTGLAGDRLVRAGYKASAHGENLALNDSIYEAQSSLLESVGHRRNIVGEAFSHVGIGVARGKGNKNKSWYLTQLFVRKVLDFDSFAESERYIDSINGERENKGIALLVEDAKLEALATEAVKQAASSNFDDLPGVYAPKAAKISQSSVSVSAHTFYDVTELKVEGVVLERRFHKIGIAIMQDEEDVHGRSFLIVIVSE